jgi:hypothetical protein
LFEERAPSGRFTPTQSAALEEGQWQLPFARAPPTIRRLFRIFVCEELKVVWKHQTSVF